MVGMALFVVLAFAAEGGCKLLCGVFFGMLVIVGALDFGGDIPLALGGDIPDRGGLLDVLRGIPFLGGELEAAFARMSLSATAGLLALEVGVESLAGLEGTDDVPCAVFPAVGGRGGVAAARRVRVGVVTKLCCGSRVSSSNSSKLKTALALAALTLTFRGVWVAAGSSFFSSSLAFSPSTSASFVVDFAFFFVDFFFLVGESSASEPLSFVFFLPSFLDFSFLDDSLSFFSFLGVSFFANRLLRRGLSEPSAPSSSLSTISIVPLINASTFSSMVSPWSAAFSLLTAILIRCTK
mmetsp:Transcript_28287/g.68816  ORF Transcript_28287/g.68816 Transcript_28287/m.68816 type:complete len:295 (-) Transcript_28287:254-1138(-)